MKTEGRRQSENVEDRRGETAGGGMGGLRFPAGGRIGRGGVGGGIGLIVVVVLALMFGVDPSQLLDSGSTGTSRIETPGQPYVETTDEAQRSAYVRVVLADTEDAWKSLFHSAGRAYEAPTMVLFRDAVDSGCGFAESAVGPFYCPTDHKLYIDLGFFDDLSRRLGASGDFATAYVIAHEVGHHVQTLLGVSDKVAAARRSGDERESNAQSVRFELQADCLAGVWASQTEKQKKVLEAGDIEEAMNAAAAVGDDRLQKRAQGYVVPESFTHGTSVERASWFKRGLTSGDMKQCDTFSGGGD